MSCSGSALTLLWSAPIGAFCNIVGGVCAPLLANVYLHEFDRWAAAKWHRSRNELAQRRRTGHGNYKLIRFADDFVVLSNAGIADVRQAKAEIKQFLETELHLKLSDEKTCITHVNQGFTFLGFHIQRVRPEGRWVVHLRPPTKAKERVKAKIKALTSRRWTWLDEYTRLTTLNVIVRGWANYYRYTSLLRDIEDITRYVWLRYLRWLRHKHPGRRVGRLIHTKSRLIHHRTRWTATLREGQQTLHAYQWLPTREEFHRRRYLRKAVAAFPQPYLGASGAGEVDYPTGTTGPDEHIYILAIGATDSQSSRHEPLTMAELRLRAKLRDGFRCQRCGRRSDLEVHHTKGTKTHHLTTLATLCRACHVAEHHHDQQEQPDGKPDEVKASHPVWREGRRRPFSES
jgi:RNA-directed DNA polymerase